MYSGGRSRGGAGTPGGPGGGEPTGLAGPFPGVAQVLGEGPGEAELGVGGDDQPGPRLRTPNRLTKSQANPTLRVRQD